MNRFVISIFKFRMIEETQREYKQLRGNFVNFFM